MRNLHTYTYALELLQLKSIKIKPNEKLAFSVALTIFQVSSSHVWLVTTISVTAGSYT